MKNCTCGARLGFIGGYRHPTKGWSEILCSNCFDDEYEKSIKWKEFILANSFVKVPSYEDFLKDCETYIIMALISILEIVNDFLTGFGNNLI